MTPADIFLKDILANPKDDTPRLIYADWLSENNQEEYGEFIRVQIELSQWVSNEAERSLSETGILRHSYLKRKERELFYGSKPDLWRLVPWAPKDWTMTTHGSAMSFRVGVKEGKQDIWHVLNRGFVETIRCSLDDFRLYGPKIVKAQPITTVTPTCREPDTDDYGNFGWLNRKTLNEELRIPEPLRMSNKWDVPDSVWRLMKPSSTPYMTNQFWKFYETGQECFQSLSDALLLWTLIKN